MTVMHFTTGGCCCCLPALVATNNGEDFFNNLPSPKGDTPLSTSGDNSLVPDAPIVDQEQYELYGLEGSVDPSFDDCIQHALVVGDYTGAVVKCIAANKMVDALVITHAGGDSLWQSTRDKYLKISCAPYLKFASREQWTMLCDTLASKLTATGKTLATTICYICAGNIDKTVEIWSRNLTTEQEGKSYVDLLQDLMEKTIVLELASGQKRFSASLCKLVEKYVKILASQGLLTTAMGKCFWSMLFFFFFFSYEVIVNGVSLYVGIFIFCCNSFPYSLSAFSRPNGLEH